jgi:predicted transport protein
MVVLIDGVRYLLTSPESEAVLEKAIKDNCHHIFGEDSFYFEKKKIKSKAGIATIPDAYLIVFDTKPRWCILEIELASHSVYEHIFPQITKFKRAIENASSRRTIVELLYDAIKADVVLEAKLKKKIGSGEIHKFISDLVSEKPTIVIAVDKRTPELEEALQDIGGDLRILEFKSYRREATLDSINAYVFEPVVRIDAVKKKATPGEIIDTLSTTASGIGQAIYQLFNEKGIENVSYAECESLAKRIKPDTKFNNSHFSWYKNKYKKMRSITPDDQTMLTAAIGQEYTEDHHTRRKPQKVVELFRTIDKFCMERDPINVQKKYRAKTVNYSHGKNIFCSVHLYTSGLRVWLKLRYSDLADPPKYARDVSNIGHWGVGDLELAIKSPETFQNAKTLIRKSFEENKSE